MIKFDCNTGNFQGFKKNLFLKIFLVKASFTLLNNLTKSQTTSVVVLHQPAGEQRPASNPLAL
jgi:hypothetical protein